MRWEPVGAVVSCKTTEVSFSVRADGYTRLQTVGVFPMGRRGMTHFAEHAALLRSVSRSFYLSVRILPAGMREPVALGYLLARASDTLADTVEAPAEVRVEALRRFREMVDQRVSRDLPVGLTLRLPEERLLIAKLPNLLSWLGEMGDQDRRDIVQVLGHIVQGQEQDLTRIGPVQTAVELDNYTFLVAGCVGEFWTRLGLRHVRKYTTMDAGPLIERAVRFGKGLQLVNILRDLDADLEGGRSYLPGDVEVEFPRWHRVAMEHFEVAQEYLLAVQPWRLRYAALLPWVLGVRTLQLLAERPRGGFGRKIKVRRSEVRGWLWRALPSACSDNAFLRLSENLGFGLASRGKLN